MQESLGAPPITRTSGGFPSLEQMGINALMPPTNNFGRKRFNSSMHDMNQNKSHGIVDQYDCWSSNLSTNNSYISEYENQRQANMKKREQQVLDRLQKIWADMALMKQEIRIQTAPDSN